MAEDGKAIDAGSQDVEALRMIQETRNHMQKAWQHDDALLQKFFPILPASRSVFQKVYATLYNDNKRYKRWKQIPSTPRSVANLYTPLVMLMNGILSRFGIKRRKRLFLNTHAVDFGDSLSPGILLAGVGPEFAATGAATPRAFYVSGITPVEVCLESENQVEARDRLAFYMQRLFQHQDNRRFAYGLVITESMATVYMFDHAGALATSPFDYHQNPAQFATLLSGMASTGDRIGFDWNMWCEGRSTIFQTFEAGPRKRAVAKRYVLKEKLFHFPSFPGRGTICWLVSSVDDPKSVFVMKDSWVAPEELEGRESEGSLLQHAQNQGVLRGIPQVHHFEEVRRSKNATNLDTVLRNRKLEAMSTEAKPHDRVHNRILMTTHGKTLDKFANRKELLFAFHDAVLAHRHLYDAGILHRDISVRNILINPEGVEGDRGILIDFDHAIRIGNTSPYSKKSPIGTWRYMSRNVLSFKGPHTYFDDLESFYYTLSWILVAYDAPNKIKPQLPRVLAEWDEPKSRMFKYGLMGEDFELPVSPWFGTSIHRLAARLHKFFQARYGAVGKPLASLTSSEDYEDFLGYIRQAIVDLIQETDSLPLALPLPPEQSVKQALPESQRQSNEHDTTDTEASPAIRCRAKRVLRTAILPLSTERPRRSTANYGD